MATNKNFVVKNGLEVGQNLVVTGSITQSGMSLPASDGSSGQFLKTDGNGTLSFATVVSDFTISDGTNTDTINTGETLTFTAGTGITTTVSDNEVTISGATQYTDSDAIAAVQGATNLTIDGGTLYVDTANNYVGIGDTSPQYMLDVGGTTGTGSIAVAGTEVIDSGAEIITAQLKDSGVTAGSYGSASLVPVITVDAKGRITSASTTSVAGVSSFSFNGTSEVLTINTADGGTYTADISALASETYVDTAVSNLVDAAPGTLDTLNELAAALGDDANFSTTVTNSLATKVSKNGDTISGALNVTGNLTIDTNTLFVDAANNRVGIGTASPSTPLHVSTSADRVATFASTDTGARIVITDGTDTGYVNVSSGKVSLGQTEGLSANNLNITASGNVGIGAIPDNKLHVEGTSSDSLIIMNSTAAPTNQESLPPALEFIGRGWNTNYGSREIRGKIEYFADYGDYGSGATQGGLRFSTEGAGGNSTAPDSLQLGMTLAAGSDSQPYPRLGIGMTSPAAKLHVRTTSLAAGSDLDEIAIIADTPFISGYQAQSASLLSGFDSTIHGTAIGMAYENPGYALTFFTNDNTSGLPTERMRINDNGNVGIGTSSPSSIFNVSGPAASPVVAELETANSNADITLQSASSGSVTRLRQYINDFQVHTNGSERMRIDSSGSLLIARTGTSNNVGGHYITPDYGYFENDGTALYLNRYGSDGEIIQFRRQNVAEGSISVTSSGTTYNTTSDRRLKDNITTITNGKEKLLAMNPVTHTWKADPEADAVHGFVAQEMQQVVPEAVSGDPDGDEMMSMDYGRITPVIVAALQDALKEIEELKTRINELEAK